jgi:hypothetical protein
MSVFPTLNQLIIGSLEVFDNVDLFLFLERLHIGRAPYCTLCGTNASLDPWEVHHPPSSRHLKLHTQPFLFFEIQLKYDRFSSKRWKIGKQRSTHHFDIIAKHSITEDIMHML